MGMAMGVWEDTDVKFMMSVHAFYDAMRYERCLWYELHAVEINERFSWLLICMFVLACLTIMPSVWMTNLFTAQSWSTKNCFVQDYILLFGLQQNQTSLTQILNQGVLSPLFDNA